MDQEDDEEQPPPEGRDPCERAVELAYRSIARRDRTVAEVRAFLERTQVEPEPAEHAIGELAEAGWLDDERFAQRFAEDKCTIERWGGERIERELTRRGVPAEAIAAAVSGQDRDDEMGAALEILAQKAGPLDGDRERDRAWRLLVRKGYEPELAYEAVREFGRRAAA
jgi:regulatory protein